jgi:hypothetical protein
MVKPLFIAGPRRSGTTGLTVYLNDHPEVLVCRERFTGWPRRLITPELLTFERIMDFEDGHEPPHRITNARRRKHRQILDRKDFAKLRYIGDKVPQYTNSLKVLSENNPGARFLITYRPVEKVAESEANRIENNPRWKGGKNGFEIGIKQWNKALQYTREFVESGVNPHVLIVSYDEFFYRNEEFIPLMERFLDIEFDESVQRVWREKSQAFEASRRPKAPLSNRLRAQIKKLADRETEAYILRRIEKQWESADAPAGGSGSPAVHPARERTNPDRRAETLLQQIEKLEAELREERHDSESLREQKRRLKRRLRSLERQIHAIRSSRTWKAASALKHIKVGVSRKG